MRILRAVRILRLVVLAMLWPAADFAAWPAQLGDQAVWDVAFDPATGTRFIPPQLVVPGKLDGARTLTMPPAMFAQPEGTRWRGPQAWHDANLNIDRQVYDRRRDTRREGGVAQKMA